MDPKKAAWLLYYLLLWCLTSTIVANYEYYEYSSSEYRNQDESKSSDGNMLQCTVPDIENGAMRRISVRTGVMHDIDLVPGQAINASSAVSLQCHPGYVPSRNLGTVSFCFYGGRWLPGIGGCFRLACGLFPDVPHGKIEWGESVTIGDSRIITCNDGYLLRGAATVTCEPNGHWTLPGSCTVSYCYDLPTVLNGYISFGNWTFGSVRSLGCIPPYTLHGPSHITCQADGRWSNPGFCSSPQCSEMSLPEIDNGAFILKNQSNYDMGEQLAASCYDGFYSPSPIIANCLPNGEWSVANGNHCQEIMKNPVQGPSVGIWTPLHQACREGNLEDVKRLVWSGANLNSRADFRNNKNFPIHEASRRGYLNIVRFLLSIQSNLSYAQAADGSLPIHAAALGGHAEVVNFFLARGVPVDAQDSEHGWTPLHQAARGGQVEVVKLLLSNGANPYAKSNAANTNDLPIHAAAFFDRVEVVKHFIEYIDANLTNATSSDGFMPIHRAAQGGNNATIGYFLQRGVTIESRDGTYGGTLLHHATLMGHLDLIEWLVDNGANPYAKSNLANNATMPIHWAVSMGMLSAVRFFVEQVDSDLCYAPTVNGDLPMHIAFLHNNMEIFDYFLSRGVSIDVRNTVAGMTALQIATSMGSPSLVKWLIRRGANASAPARDGYLAVHFAAGLGRLPILKYLVEHVNSSYADISTLTGLLPIHVASQRGHIDIVDYFLSTLNTDINVATTDLLDRTPLHIAAFNGHVELIKWLVLKGANVHLQAANGALAIHEGALGGHVDVVDYFVTQLEIPIDIKSGVSERTPLHYAALNGHVNLVMWLVAKGANPYAKSSMVDYELRPIHVAALFGRLPVVKYFVEHFPSMITSLNGRGNNPLEEAQAGREAGSAAVTSYLASQMQRL